jgi:hypothetical protein
MPAEHGHSDSAPGPPEPAFERFVRAGFEQLGFEADGVTMAVISVVDTLYGPLIDRLMRVDLGQVEAEPGIDLSAPPPEAERR